eukprot:scaffold37781_cov198-Skeletonema_marinoi.AAC.6
MLRPRRYLVRPNLGLTQGTTFNHHVTANGVNRSLRDGDSMDEDFVSTTPNKNKSRKQTLSTATRSVVVVAPLEIVQSTMQCQDSNIAKSSTNDTAHIFTSTSPTIEVVRFH